MSDTIPLSLIEHGTTVFGSKEIFLLWMSKENFFFDKKAPIEFITTAEGLEYIDNKLAGIEYGDNV